MATVSIWTGTAVTVELAGLPPLRLALDEAGAPSPLLQMLRPRVTLERNGVKLVQSAPYGAPEEGVPWGLVMITAGVLGVLWCFAE